MKLIELLDLIEAHGGFDKVFIKEQKYLNKKRRIYSGIGIFKRKFSDILGEEIDYKISHINSTQSKKLQEMGMEYELVVY